MANTAYADAKKFAVNPTPDYVGVLVGKRFRTDLSDRTNLPAGTDPIVTTDSLQIGVVPAGYVLVPHLCNIRIPVLDVAAGGDYSIGTIADPDALAAAAAAETARALFGEDFTLTNVVGDIDDDVAIIIKPTTNFTALDATGVILADLVYRVFDPVLDVAT